MAQCILHIMLIKPVFFIFFIVLKIFFVRKVDFWDVFQTHQLLKLWGCDGLHRPFQRGGIWRVVNDTEKCTFLKHGTFKLKFCPYLKSGTWATQNDIPLPAGRDTARQIQIIRCSQYCDGVNEIHWLDYWTYFEELVLYFSISLFCYFILPFLYILEANKHQALINIFYLYWGKNNKQTKQKIAASDNQKNADNSTWLLAKIIISQPIIYNTTCI